MRNLTRLLILLIVYVGLLMGCVEGFKIVLTDIGDRTPIFRLMSAGVMLRLGVEIDSFYVYSLQDKKEDFVWRIESVDNKRHLIEEIKYGVVPKGFREIIVPRHLVSGGNYVAGSRMPGKTGWVDFVLK